MRSLNHIAVVVSLSAEACGLCRCCLSVSEHADHVVRPFTLKELFAHLPGRQQKHYPVPQKAKTNPLLLGEVIDVLFKLFFLRFVCRDESHYSLNWILVHVFKVGAMWYIKVVLLVTQEGLHHLDNPVFGSMDISHHVRLHQYAMLLIPSHKSWPQVPFLVLEKRV